MPAVPKGLSTVPLHCTCKTSACQRMVEYAVVLVVLLLVVVMCCIATRFGRYYDRIYTADKEAPDDITDTSLPRTESDLLTAYAAEDQFRQDSVSISIQI